MTDSRKIGFCGWRQDTPVAAEIVFKRWLRKHGLPKPNPVSYYGTNFQVYPGYMVVETRPQGLAKEMGVEFSAVFPYSGLRERRRAMRAAKTELEARGYSG